MDRRVLHKHRPACLVWTWADLGDGNDRRSAVRYRPVVPNVWVSWTQEGQYRDVAACLHDISQTGALVLIKDRLGLTKDQRVWIALDGSASPEWVEASVVAWESRWFGPNRLRLHFHQGSCSYGLFRDSVFGSEVMNRGPTPPAESTDPRDSDWR